MAQMIKRDSLDNSFLLWEEDEGPMAMYKKGWNAALAAVFAMPTIEISQAAITGQRIKALRQSLEVDRITAAEDLGLCKDDFGRWERGDFMPCDHTLNLLAEYFGCTVDYLLGNEDDELL